MSTPRLPRFAIWLLTRRVAAEWRDSIEGGLLEERGSPRGETGLGDGTTLIHEFGDGLVRRQVRRRRTRRRLTSLDSVN